MKIKLEYILLKNIYIALKHLGGEKKNLFDEELSRVGKKQQEFSAGFSCQIRAGI